MIDNIKERGEANMSVLVHCWGKYACFTRPEMKAERVSYDVMTPSAARGIMDAIYWHPGVSWVIQRIWVRKPVKFTNIRRNELKSVMNGKAVVSAIMKSDVLPTCNPNDDRTQRASMVLKDVDYYIQAYVTVDEQRCGHTAQEVDRMIVKRLEKGQCYHRPCFGCREFPVQFEMTDEIPPCPEELVGEQDLNWMFWDFNYGKPGSQPKPLFFRPVMKDGLIEVPERGDLP